MEDTNNMGGAPSDDTAMPEQQQMDDAGRMATDPLMAKAAEALRVESAQLEDMKKQCEEYLGGWQRAVADYANLKREAERGAAEMGKYAAAGVITGLLPILDSFAKAHAARPIQGDADAAKMLQWADGIGHIKSQLDGALAKLGLTTIDEIGVPFDAARHEAMMMEKAPDVASGTVVRLLEAGYKMHDRVLRPAKVVVAE
ncbi:MAG: hypothetical protein RLZZ324_718 [Candidatus Parcubacteria bacterium]|jgi:molecular chaperone GrpE